MEVLSPTLSAANMKPVNCFKTNFAHLKHVNGFKTNFRGRVFCKGIDIGWDFGGGFSIGREENRIDGLKRTPLVVVKAKKNKKKEKEDTHSFTAKPDEATGPFPEAVLLKKKEVQEDGRLLPEFADAEEEQLYEFLSLQKESDMDIDRTRHYEVVYLIHEDRVDEVDCVVSKFQDYINEKSGKIWRLNNWGLRRLAYKIKKARNANYILMNFELGAQWINELKSLLDKDERVIRHLVIKRDKAISEDCPPPPEFHTLHPNFMADDMDDEDGDIEEYDVDDYDEEEDEETKMVGDDDDDDVDDDGKGFDDESVGIREREGRTVKAEKVAR
ncbi:hypothetical protein AMTRI_Chr05g65640 [Amborella trichopoda]|uniref:uncharacterized protein LOC18431908 n=1 Tax=Amborella trichopoda TaxID=13333 RepID=UPI0005D39103|nr:uncharacterized protein LOC18431908 [Amborella trichopoda]|eukprot:XP_011622484.1 uncharacterized protein LOC18431908 [Amborella trichopoda]